MAKKSSNVKVTVSKELYNDLERYGRNFCIGMATQVRDNLTLSAAVAIESFYEDYTPRYYKRHYYNFRERSFKKFYENKHGRIIRGGVELTPNALDDIYKDSKEEVFDMVFAGYHGVASGFNEPYTFTPVHIMQPSPMEIISNSQATIINHIDRFEAYGYKRANQEMYNTFVRKLHVKSTIGGTRWLWHNMV